MFLKLLKNKNPIQTKTIAMPKIEIIVRVEDIEDAMQRFNSLDVAEATRRDYKYRIPFFLNFVAMSGGVITEDTYLNYKRLLVSRTDLSASTKHKYLTVAKIYLQQLHYKDGILPKDITFGVKPIKRDARHKMGINLDEILKIEQKLNRIEDTPLNARTKALFCLLCYQGLRQVEVIRLDREDLDLTNGIAKVQGKGEIDKRIIDLHPDTIKDLMNYIKLNKIGSGALFKSNYGRRQSTRLNSITIKREFKKIFDEVDIVNKTTHGLRHHYATEVIKKIGFAKAKPFTRHESDSALRNYDDEIKTKKDKIKVFSCFGSLRAAAT